MDATGRAFSSRTALFEQDDHSDELISKSTWSLKISGLVCGVLLVLGRSASYGNVTWTPVYHAPSSPLVVLIVEKPSKAPAPARVGRSQLGTAFRVAPCPIASRAFIVGDELVDIPIGFNHLSLVIDGRKRVIFVGQETLWTPENTQWRLRRAPYAPLRCLARVCAALRAARPAVEPLV